MRFVHVCTILYPTHPKTSLLAVKVRIADCKEIQERMRKKTAFCRFSNAPPLVLSQIYELLAVWCLRYRVHSLGHSLVTHREGMIKHYLKSLKNLKRWRSPQSSEKKKTPKLPSMFFLISIHVTCSSLLRFSHAECVLSKNSSSSAKLLPRHGQSVAMLTGSHGCKWFRYAVRLRD